MKSFILTLFISLCYSFTYSQSIEINYSDGSTKLFPEDYRYYGPDLNSKFPLMNYVDIYGDSITNDEIDNKIVLINIWSIGCTGCKLEEPFLKNLTTKYQNSEKVEFISICTNSDRAARNYYKKNGDFGYRTLSLTRKEIKEIFKSVATPTHFIVNKGKLLHNFTIPVALDVTYNWVDDKIDELIR